MLYVGAMGLGIGEVLGLRVGRLDLMSLDRRRCAWPRVHRRG